MLYTLVAFIALTAGANALTIGAAAKRPTAVTSMKIERLPGEGDPFSDGIRKPEEGPRPDISIGRYHADSGYIDIEDEPWHSTSRPRTATVTKGALEACFESALPFIAPEEALMDALRAASSPDDVDAAVKACLAAGGRPGCPAIETAEKMLAAAKKDGELKPAKAAKVAAQGKGWDDMARSLAATHDNSI